MVLIWVKLTFVFENFLKLKRKEKKGEKKDTLENFVLFIHYLHACLPITLQVTCNYFIQIFMLWFIYYCSDKSKDYMYLASADLNEAYVIAYI